MVTMPTVLSLTYQKQRQQRQKTQQTKRKQQLSRVPSALGLFLLSFFPTGFEEAGTSRQPEAEVAFRLSRPSPFPGGGRRNGRREQARAHRKEGGKSP